MVEKTKTKNTLPFPSLPVEIVIVSGIFASDSLNGSQEMTNWNLIHIKSKFYSGQRLLVTASGKHHEKSECYTDFPEGNTGHTKMLESEALLSVVLW